MANRRPLPADLVLSRPNSAKGKLQRIALDYLRTKQARGEIPTSIRFVFYELEQLGLISKERPEVQPGCKTAHTPAQSLTSAITRLRELRLVPWDWIIDESRKVEDWTTPHGTVREAVYSYAEHCRIDPWEGDPPVLIAESRGVAGVITRAIAYEYAVAVCGIGGNCRGFLETVVNDLVEDRRVLYLGDADDCGNAIEAHTRGVLVRAAKWERLAITPEQVKMLRTAGVKPVQKNDSRYLDGNPHPAFECEALGQSEIVQMVQERLDALLPEPLSHLRVRADEQRAALREMLEEYSARDY